MGKIKVGILGIGRAGWGMHANEIGSWPEMYEIVAACDVIQERVDMMEDKFKARGYTDIKAFLADPEIELVSIATRSPDHVPHAMLALEAGKYVLVEKPVGISFEDADRLEAAAAKYPGKLFFRHNRRFEPAFQHIREIMASGILGEIYEIKLCRHGYQRRDDWQTIIECGGGQLNNWGPHLVDHGLRLLESPLKEQWSNLKRIAAVGDAEDHLKIILRGENNRVIDIEISGGIALPSPVYAVYGTRGSLICEDEQDIKMKYLDPEVPLQQIAAKKETPPMTGSFGNTEPLKWRRQTIMVEPASKCDTHHIWKHLYAAIREGVPFPVKTEEALAVVRVISKVKQGTEFARKG